MTDSTYNGWHNYETWLVKLWIDNDEGEQQFWLEQASGAEKYDLAQAMRDHYEEGASELVGNAGMYSDLLTAALGSVDWYEIAEALISEAEEQIEA